MTKQTNPFFNFDMTKVMAEFDPTKMMSEFTKNFGDIKVPGLDPEAMMETQRKNFEALTSANKVALEGMQAVVRRQAEILQQTMDEMTSTLSGLAAGGTPQEAAAKQVEQVKGAFEKALTNARELAEMSAKSNAEAADAINKRFTESMDEVKQQLLAIKK
ncbi:phasin family protein [Magnetospira sp. QH-2]|uniref:phasin family protein n=1 Tax=Magnetospira sp. (strain QH-2) TaxID=1288970 RepID=UPI0003E81426|nr:phasin family protein [Magnetospira sp. QH-2]CCQ72286.1 magnetic particle membrane-associated GTPase P16 (PHA granule-associate protein, Phasin family) [Magnetospira sp. QH-2]